MSKNTDPEFYAHWTTKQLVDELVRLNKLLENVLKGLKNGKK